MAYILIIKQDKEYKHPDPNKESWEPGDLVVIREDSAPISRREVSAFDILKFEGRPTSDFGPLSEKLNEGGKTSLWKWDPVFNRFENKKTKEIIGLSDI